MEKEIINFRIIWDFASTKRQKRGEPVSVFSHIVPIIACSSNKLKSIAVNRNYEAVVNPEKGIVFHRWKERFHVDPISTGEFGWEIPVYDTELYKDKEWSVFFDGKKYKVPLPSKPDLDVAKTFLKMVGEGANRLVHVAAGEWEVIRQKVGVDGIYKEDRRLVSGPLSFEVEVDEKSNYDALLITRPTWEEKIIMHGELNEK